MAVTNLESTSKTTSFHLIAAHPKNGPAAVSRVSLFIVSVLFAFLTSWCRANRIAGKDARANMRETWPIGSFFLSRSGPRWPSFSVSTYFFLTLSLSKSFKRDWPEVSSSWMTTERFRGKNQDMNHLRRVLRTLLELGNQKRTILPSQNPSFHLSSPDEWSGCPLTRKPSFYVFVSLSFSDTFKS